MGSGWNFADVWEAIAQVQPDAPALVQGGRRLSWGDFDRRAEGVARSLAESGAGHQDKAALYLSNCPEYLEAFFATVKVSMVPVNTNYRYADDELVYLWDDADAAAVVFHGTYTDRVARVRPRVPHVRAWLWVDDGSEPCPSWAIPYEDAASSGGRAAVPWARSGDDLVFLYTGGTTGMPKGVMWRQDDLFARVNAAGFRHYDEDAGIDGIRATLDANGPGMSILPAAPLMHGTGAFTAVECLNEGGRVVLLESRKFDPEELFDTVEREKVDGVVIVGDPFARPMLAALDANPGRWDLSSVVGILSAGAMWSVEVKRGLLRHRPEMVLMDAFSSSEAVGLAASLSSGTAATTTAEFTLGPEVKVLGADGQPVEPGSGEIGVLALPGRNPLGYYKDPEKTTTAFRVIDGIRYSVPGDFAEVRADGSVHVLGRGSGVINTGGEKVFAEEVEEALKTHPQVRDAAVVGVADDRFGEIVVALVEPSGGVAPTGDDLVEHVKTHLAPFKAPRRVRIVESVGRAPNGKLDHRRLKKEAARLLAAGDRSEEVEARPEDAAAKEARPEDAAAKEVRPEDAAAKEARPEDAAAKEARRAESQPAP